MTAHNQTLRTTRRLSTARLKALLAGTTLAAGLLSGAGAATAQDHAWVLNQVGGSFSTDISTPAITNITQHSSRAIGEGNLDIAAYQTVNIFQNSNGDLFVARDIKADPTRIFGNLNANGRVLIIDNNGVFFEPGSSINVGGIIATTGDVSNADIMAGHSKFEFSNFGAGAAVVNNGTINVADAGLAAFVSPTVINNGVINARLGKVAFGAGSKVTLDLYGDQLLEIAVDDKMADALIEHNGAINAEGGVVQMTAQAAKAAVDDVINLKGVVTVASATQKGGKIILSGGGQGTVKVSGSADDSGATGGGDITVTGENIEVSGSGTLLADATGNGNGGNIIIFGDKYAILSGRASAQGGALGGNGGFIELSARETVGFDGAVSTWAELGSLGLFLIDPRYIIIHSGSTDAPAGGDIPGTGNEKYVVSAAALAKALGSASVVLQADNFIDVGTRNSYVGIDLGGHTVDHSKLGHDHIDLSTTASGSSGQGQGNPQSGNANCNANSSCAGEQKTTTGSLRLESNTVNFNRNLIMGTGSVTVDAQNLNLNGVISGLNNTGDTVTLGDNRLSGTGKLTHIGVLSNAARINQAVSFADGAHHHQITIHNGTYNESVLIDGRTNLTLIGQSKTGTVIAPNSPGVHVKNSTDVTVLGLTIDGGSDGVLVENSNGTLVDNVVFKNQTANAVRIFGGSQSAEVGFSTMALNAGVNGVNINGGDGHLVRNNTIDGGQFGIIQTGGSSEIHDNIIGQTTGTSNDSIRVSNLTGDSKIHANRIYQAGWDGIAVHNGTAKVDVSNNIIEDITGASGIAFINHTGKGEVDGNTITGTDRLGIYVLGADGLRVHTNTISSTGREGGWHGAGIHLEASNNMLVQNNTINTTNGDAIHIGGGNYGVVNTTGNRIVDNKIGMNGGVGNIRGDGIYATHSDNLEITGNTVQNTASTGFDKGSGIQVVNATNVNISDKNKIMTAAWDGIRLQNVNDVTVDNNEIEHVTRVGIYGGNINTATIHDNLVRHGNLADYGGISTDGGSNLTITENDISHITGHGVRIHNAGGTNLIDGNIL